MTEEQVFEQLKLWREWTVEYLQTIPEAIVDQIPTGHNNSIRWNAGHILVGWDHTIFPAVNVDRQMPISYHLMFSGGSKPENWKEEPPSMDKLIKQLEKQAILIERVCRGRLDEQLKEPFLGMRTLGDMVFFHLNHENLHMGTIKSMKQMLLK